MSWRPTVRLKLTLVYGGLFVAAGLILITLSYSLVRFRNADPAPRRPLTERIQERIDRDDLDVVVEEARRDERQVALRQVWRQSLLALLIMTIGAVAVGWLMAGQMLSPIRRITAHARSSSATTFDERIQLDGPDDELKELADTFDAMLDRLQAAFRAQQGFAAQASHELRTPLAIIRAEAELARSQEQANPNVDAILKAVERSERLVDSLLALTRSESTMLDLSPLDLADAVGDAVGEQLRSATAAGISIDLALEAATILGDRDLLSRLTHNLVENAIRYNEPGGSVRVAVRQVEGFAELQVENSGTVLTEIELGDIFRPFVRGEWARRHRIGGFGLGLAIVRSVATAHRGEVAAEPRPSGGLIVTLRLPAT